MSVLWYRKHVNKGQANEATHVVVGLQHLQDGVDVVDVVQPQSAPLWTLTTYKSTTLSFSICLYYLTNNRETGGQQGTGRLNVKRRSTGNRETEYRKTVNKGQGD